MQKLDNPYMNLEDTYNPNARGASPDNKSANKSDIEQIHEFMDECDEELKSVDHAVKSLGQ